MHEVIDRSKSCGRGECPNPARWRDHLAVPAEEIEKARVRIDRLEAVQHKDLVARAAAHNFELDPAAVSRSRTAIVSFPSGQCIATDV